MFFALFLIAAQAPEKIDANLNFDSCTHILKGVFEYTYPHNYKGKRETSVHRLVGKNSKLLKKIDFYITAMERTENEWIFGTDLGDILLYSTDLKLKRKDVVPKNAKINGIFKYKNDSALILDNCGVLYNYDLKSGEFNAIYKSPDNSKIIYSNTNNLAYIYNDVHVEFFNINLKKVTFKTSISRPIKKIGLVSEESKIAVIYRAKSFDHFFSSNKTTFQQFDLLNAISGDFLETRKISENEDILACEIGPENFWFIITKNNFKVLFKIIDPTKAPDSIITSDPDKSGPLNKEILKNELLPVIYFAGKKTFIVRAGDCYLFENR